MSLSGNLGFVSLDEVLRLLNRSNQRGLVDVKGDSVNGRIFFDRGGVTLATTFEDDELASHIARSETPEGTAMASLLREMAVETLHQLAAHGRTFDVIEQRSAGIGASTPFDLEELLADARRRFDEWTEVSSVVTDLESLLRMRRDLGERDRVTLDRDSWRLLSEIGSGASVKTLARQLGTTDFWAARVAAGMVEEDLLGLNGNATPEEAPAWSESESASEAHEPELISFEASSYEAPHDAVADEDVTDEFAASDYGTTEETETEFAQSEPVFAETPLTEDAAVSAATSEPGTEPADVDPNVSWWTEPEPSKASDENDGEEVKEDTEAFLEKVFSGLDSNEAPEEGYGLLRRRRLGALRDLSNDS